MSYELTAPAKIDFGQSFVESPLLWAGTWLLNVSVPYIPGPLVESALVTFRNSAGEQVGPTWDIPVRQCGNPLTLQGEAFITLSAETKLKVLVNGLTIPATITYLRLQP